MATRPIRITASDLATGALTLDDRGHSVVDPGDTILWQIGNNSGVDAIISINEKSGSSNIFTRPPAQQGNNWRGEVSPTIGNCTIYIYSIVWRRGTDTRTFDPIISIRPSRNKYTLTNYLVNFSVFVVGFLTSLIYWRMEKMKMNKEIERLKNNKM